MTPHPLADRIARLIEDELQNHRACRVSVIGGRSATSDELIGFHRGLHWVLNVLAEALAQGVPPSPLQEMLEQTDDRTPLGLCWLIYKRNEAQGSDGLATISADKLTDIIDEYQKILAVVQRRKASGVPPASAPDSTHRVTVSLDPSTPARCSCGLTFWPNVDALDKIICPAGAPPVPSEPAP
jgi:hypothetical protein